MRYYVEKEKGQGARLVSEEAILKVYPSALSAPVDAIWTTD